MAILVNEFAVLYAGRQLEPMRIQYKDFAEWQKAFLQSDLLKQQEAYWLGQMAGEVPVLNLPTDYARPTVQSLEGDRLSTVLNRELTAELQKIAQATGSTLYMVLLAAVNILLARYSGQEDILVGSPIAGRPHPDLDKVIGMFVNTLVMRNKPEGSRTFSEFLQEVRFNALKAYENQDYQFEELVDKLDLKRDLGRNPLFDVMFVMQNMDNEQLNLEDLKLIPHQFESKTAKFDLTIFATETAGEMALEFEYSSRLFKRETVARLIGHFANILQSIAGNTGVKLSAIEMLSLAEKDQLLYAFNDTYADYPRDKTIHALFEEQVSKVSDQVAVMGNGRTLTYGELNARANRLARALRREGVTANSIVAILMDRSPEMVIGIFATLKAGGAYLPIAPDYPS